MKTLAISIQTKHISALSTEYLFERKVRRVSVGVLFILLFAYAYLVTASVFNVMGREEALSDIERLTGLTATLEQSLFEKTERVTRARGSDLGLAPVGQTTYVQSENTVVGAAAETLY